MINCIFFFICVLVLLIGVVMVDYLLYIIYINDLYLCIELISKYDGICSVEDNDVGECFGGVVCVVIMINQLCEELVGENVIVLDVGDQYQGLLMYMIYKGDVEIEFMEQIGFDVMVVGNYEFDDGDEGLVKLVDGVLFLIIFGNIDVLFLNIFVGKVEDYVILEVGGEKIGIVLVLVVDIVEILSLLDVVIFLDEIENLQYDVDVLIDMGVIKIIVLNYVGVNKDMEIVVLVLGLDVVVGGYLYIKFLNIEEGVMVYLIMVGGVLVVQVYVYLKYVGYLILMFDDVGNVILVIGDIILLDVFVVEDEVIKVCVVELVGLIEEMKICVVVEINVVIEGDCLVCCVMECEMGNFVVDVMFDCVVG